MSLISLLDPGRWMLKKVRFFGGSGCRCQEHRFLLVIRHCQCLVKKKRIGGRVVPGESSGLPLALSILSLAVKRQGSRSSGSNLRMRRKKRLESGAAQIFRTMYPGFSRRREILLSQKMQSTELKMPAFSFDTRCV